MSALQVALVAGFFVIPMALLWLGHAFRHRGRREQALFWGGLVGHTLAMPVTLLAAHWPPLAWSAAPVRAWLVHGALVLGAIIGALAGLAIVGMHEPRRAQEP